MEYLVAAAPHDADNGNAADRIDENDQGSDDQEGHGELFCRFGNLIEGYDGPPQEKETERQNKAESHA